RRPGAGGRGGGVSGCLGHDRPESRRLPARRVSVGGKRLGSLVTTHHEGDRPMQGLMQDLPLTLTHFHMRAERLFFDKQVATVTAAGKQRLTYGEWADR